MKKILFALVATIAFAGCSKDDDRNGNDNSALYGKWETLYTMSRETINDDWEVEREYPKGKMIYSFNEEGFNGGWVDDQCSIFHLHLDVMEIMLQLAYPNQKVYKLTDTEFELEVEWTNGLEKYVMKRIE